jgi:hypothetical protein
VRSMGGLRMARGKKKAFTPRPAFDYSRVEEALEARNEALGQIYAAKTSAEPEPPAVPPESESTPQPVETEEFLFDCRPTCPSCGYPIDEGSAQTGICPNCDEILDIETPDEEDAIEQPFDDQQELPLLD